MSKGAEFELKTLAYLKNLFDTLGFRVWEYRRQSAGTQNGFDIRISFHDETGRSRSIYFECKDYTTPLSWDDIAVKIFKIHSSSHRPDAFIAISPHVNLFNGIINDIEKLQLTIQAPIKCWSPETCVREFFSLDAAFYVDVYGENPGPEYKDRAAILEKLKGSIKDLLRQRDQLIKQPPVTFFPKELTLNIPRIDPANVIGRDEELLEVHQLLFSTNNQVVVVNGMGGIGKTTLAQAYISKYLEEYAHVAWITQLTGDIIGDISSTIGLSESLQVSTEEKNAERLFQEIMRRMISMPDGPNLLILDNVEEKLAKWKNYLPGKPQWHLLATSRQHIEGFYIKELDFLSPENAIALFKKHCSLIKEDEVVAKLVEEVDYHTLTIEVLAKTAQLQRSPIHALRNAIKQDLRANVYIQHKGERIDNVLSYLSSIFDCSGLDENQQWLVKQFACLPTEFHSYGMLQQLIRPDKERLVGFPEACNRLVERGWLLYDAGADAYKMHVIIQEVAKRQLAPALQDVGPLMEGIIENLSLVYSKDNPVDKFKWIPFGYALLNILTSDTGAEVGRLQNNLSLMLSAQGDYAGAKGLAEKAVASAERNFGPDHPNTAVSYSMLAIALKSQGDCVGAKGLFEKVAASTEHNFGPDHPETAISYSNLATVLQDLGDYVGAKELLEKAIPSAERNFGPDHPNTTVSYMHLAMALKGMGDYVSARGLLEKAVTSDERNFGPDHPTTAVSYSKLAIVLQNLGDYSKALDLFAKSLVILKKLLPGGHPYISAVQHCYDSINREGIGT